MAANIFKRSCQLAETVTGRSGAHRFQRLTRLCAGGLVAAAWGCQPNHAETPLPAQRTDARTISTVSTLENQVIDAINRRRSSGGLARLTRDRSLDSAARYHAANMARLRTMSHTLPGTTAPAFPDRIRRVGYRYRRIAENIAYGQLTAAEVVDGWMRSAGHRENIMNPALTETGMGIARASNGQLYFCQVFGRPL